MARVWSHTFPADRAAGTVTRRRSRPIPEIFWRSAARPPTSWGFFAVQSEHAKPAFVADTISAETRPPRHARSDPQLADEAASAQRNSRKRQNPRLQGLARRLTKVPRRRPMGYCLRWKQKGQVCVPPIHLTIAFVSADPPCGNGWYERVIASVPRALQYPLGAQHGVTVRKSRTIRRHSSAIAEQRQQMHRRLATRHLNQCWVGGN